MSADTNDRKAKRVVFGDEPWLPSSYTYATVTAIQALAKGKASEEQQKRALDWIINGACETYNMSFRPDSSRNTDFALGKQYVGQQIVKLVNINPLIVRKLQNDHGDEQIGSSQPARRTRRRRTSE